MDKMVLLVEDNPDDVELTLRAFKKNNILNPVRVAKDGVEALNILGLGEKPAAKPVLPAVVLLDLKLPKIDGMEVLRRIRANECTTSGGSPKLETLNSKSGLGFRTSDLVLLCYLENISGMRLWLWSAAACCRFGHPKLASGMGRICLCREQASGTRKRKQACALHRTTQCNIVILGLAFRPGLYWLLLNEPPPSNGG
jgi:CheY-like chemotaxis protein